MLVGRKKPPEDAGDSASIVLLYKCTITYSIKWAQLRWTRTLQPEKGVIYWKHERSTQIWVTWRGTLGINWLLYFSDMYPKELDMMLIWTRFKMKKRMWFFMWHAVDLWKSLPKDWRQMKAEWTSTWERALLTFTNWVTNCVRVRKSPWLKVARSHKFPFLSFLYMSTCDNCWRENTEQSRPLPWDSVMFFLVLCSYMPFFFFFKCYKN